MFGQPNDGKIVHNERFEILPTIWSQMDWLWICDARPRLVEEKTHLRVCDYSSRVANIRKGDHVIRPRTLPEFWFWLRLQPFCCGGGGGGGIVTSSGEVRMKN